VPSNRYSAPNRTTTPYAWLPMSLHDDQPPRRLKTREEILAEAKPLPPRSEMLIEDLTDEEFDAFWKAITEA